MDKVGCDLICKNHSARSDRDQYRICPTKLSKQELEQLYYTLLENNLELKKTVNVQEDRIKVLSTKVQRMVSAQKVVRAEERKDCCMAVKAVVNQQKEMITELKRSNERMADRIRKLNMRLCSAKQFCKSSTPRCLRCSTATSPYLIKHSPTSYKHQSQSTLKFAISCQNLSREAMITKCVQTDSCDTAKHKGDKQCEDNKCRTLLDELKQKILNLQEELSRTQTENASRVNTIESELQQAREDTVRVRAERVAAEHDLSNKEKRIAHLVTSLRAAEGLCTELRTQLSIEKRKVAELETRLKAATISNRMTQTIEDTLTSIQESNKSTATDVTLTCSCSPRHHIAENTQQTKDSIYGDENKLSKCTDDSGYIDTSRSQNLLDDQSLNKIIEELTNRILVLQTQVDALTISPPEVNTQESRSKTTQENTTTDDHSNILTEVESTKVASKTAVQTPPDTVIQQSNDTTESQVVLSTDSKPIVDDKKVIIHKSDQQDKTLSSPTPIIETGQENASWKAGVAKLTIVTKITNEKDANTEGNINKRSDSIKGNIDKDNDNTNTEKSKVKVNDKDHCENIKEKSISIEEKTYNVPEKDKNFTKADKNPVVEEKGNVEVDKKMPDNGINVAANMDKNVPETDNDRDNIHKNVSEKVKNGKKREKSVDKKDHFVRKDSNKSKNKEKAAGQKNNDSPKRSLKERVDIEDKSNEEFVAKNKVKMFKSTDQKAPITRSKTLVRAQTEFQDETTGEEATYTVDCDKTMGDSSPYNTDYEISSMTDLPEEKEPKSPTKNRLSPGEQKHTSTVTDSIASPSTNYSLSEGEIPITSVKRRTNEEKLRTDTGPKTSVPKMDETLQAITNELALCKRLLFSQRSHDSAVPSTMRNDNISPSHSSSVPRRWASTS